MARPQCQRRIAGRPRARVFKPRGIPLHALAEVHLSTDGWEALRLCDYEGLDQETAAKRLGVSRPTVSRILERARKAVAQALVEGCSLVIDMPADVVQACGACQGTWPGPASLTSCPACGSCCMHLLVHPDAQPDVAPNSET
jgi:uncharacterized protein